MSKSLRRLWLVVSLGISLAVTGAAGCTSSETTSDMTSIDEPKAETDTVVAPLADSTTSTSVGTSTLPPATTEASTTTVAATTSTSTTIAPTTTAKSTTTFRATTTTAPPPAPTTTSATAPAATTATTAAPSTTAPTTTAAPAPPETTAAPTPAVPANPGDSRNCGDFSTYAEAKTWFDTYYPYYGDVARLDSDGDLEPCESLPGGP